MKELYVLIQVLLLTVVFFCSTADKESFILGGFDVSDDDRKVVFSFKEDQSTSISILDLTSKKTKKIIEGSPEWAYGDPFFVKGDSLILYVKLRNNVQSSAICLFNINYNYEECIYSDEQVILEAFMLNQDELVFTKASEYSKSSPIGMKNAKGMDLYKFNMKNRKVSKLTDYNFYRINNIGIIDSEIIFDVKDSRYNGLYKYSFIEDSLIDISPTNDPREGKKYYSNPVFSKLDGKIYFTAPYQIYKMDRLENLADLVLDKGNGIITDLMPLALSNEIIFIKQRDANFYLMNLDSKQIETIDFLIE